MWKQEGSLRCHSSEVIHLDFIGGGGQGLLLTWSSLISGGRLAGGNLEVSITLVLHELCGPNSGSSACKASLPHAPFLAAFLRRKCYLSTLGDKSETEF